VLKARQRLGKYRIEKRISEGGFATVYQAMDTIEGIRVALKIPHARNINEEILNDFRHEVRLAAQLEHPHILPLKNASFIDGHFVIVFPLGERTLSDRLQSRLSLKTALNYGEQMIEAVAFAHSHRIIHCDIKPENLILFSGNCLRLTDFGIAKVAQRTVRGSGTGTVGYMAPEQAMGKPSMRSDVFSLGLILYRMLAGKWPEWPFHWPPPNFHRLRGRVHPQLIAVIRRAIDPQPRKRYRDAEQMLKAYLPAKTKALKHDARKRRHTSLAR
jgi:serine/threonine-protein kinase